ncbi:hypothetical protein RUM43_005646 [Polyplax serrata]|uniref:Uncharacterized protein n=1 Tax=Polyplax serrata TaxID=468196 RepID=A0AAN8PDT7_POLSC
MDEMKKDSSITGTKGKHPRRSEVVRKTAVVDDDDDDDGRDVDGSPDGNHEKVV